MNIPGIKKTAPSTAAVTADSLIEGVKAQVQRLFAFAEAKQKESDQIQATVNSLQNRQQAVLAESSKATYYATKVEALFLPTGTDANQEQEPTAQ